MIKADISGIFPTPIYTVMLGRKFTQQELRFVKKMKTACIKNTGNIRSINTHVLDVPSFATLKKEINLFIKDYFSKILSPPKSVFPYITQSWLNYTEKNEYHHGHAHPNSYISGVFYIDADKAYDKITFKQDRYLQILPSVTKWNIFNSESWFFPVQSGELIMFPSSLIHPVEKKRGDNTRISLSFNVFLKGILGKENQLYQLKL